MKKNQFVFSFLTFLFISCNLYAQNISSPIIENNNKVESLPSIPFLPDPLIANEGTPTASSITVMAQWKAKRNWIKEQYQHWISGTVPPAPKTFSVKIISERKESDVIIRMVELHFGPEQKGKLTVELMIPPSSKKLPVFMTQWNHRGWAQIAVRRGYIGCVYAGADDKDDTRNFDTLYPGYSFSTLMKRAWAASRAIDYLYTLKEVDTSRIGITGHSRNAKQSLLVAAFDDRINAVVSSSGGTGAENPFRYTSEPFDNESIDDITTNFPDWFHPNLRLFIGKEDKLPVDQNSLMALIAPRGLLLSTALTELEGGPWGIEQAYKSAKKVYHFLGAEDKLGILYRNGRHSTSARDIENYLDYFDYVFGRSIIKPENRLYYDYSFEKWEKISKEKINPLDFPVHKDEFNKANNPDIAISQQKIRRQIQWLLGDEPKAVSGTGVINFTSSNPTDDYLTDVILHPHLDTAIKEMIVGPYNALGENLWGNIYFPPGTVMEIDSIKGELPLVIFLHEYAYGTGYRRRCESIITNFVNSGFAVLAFDMIGYGTRIEEFKNFYNRYPHWSIMGKMVADTRLIINDAFTRMDFIDTANVFLVGYSLGGTVALLTSALDNRIKGIAVVSAFDSWRRRDNTTEGIKHFSHLHGLIPRLGFFVNNENRIPIDFDEILSALAPRNLFVIAPTRDRYHPAKQVNQISTNASKYYTQLNAKSHFTLSQPETYNHFTEEMQKEICDWMLKVKNEKE